MRRKLIAGNWKMNGSQTANATLLEGIKSELGSSACAVAVCVPAPYYAQCRDLLRGTSMAWGGQDISIHSSGAYTGEVSGAMLADFDCTYVIVGHSERRTYHGESNDAIAKKTLSALASGITPIVCVGESLSEREEGRTNEVVGAQIEAVLSVLDASQVARIVIAYEPVWAIGTGKTATPEMAQEVHAMLRQRLLAKDAVAGEVVQLLYGGSMKPGNARELLAMRDIDGGLIGGASLKAADFLAIVKAAQR